jgi:hypothetical protein
MFRELWRSGPIGHIVADVLLAMSIIVSAYLLFIAYRKLVTYIGLGNVRKTTVNYAVLYDLLNPYAKGEIQLGFELKEETEVTLQLLNKEDKVLKVFKDEKIVKGIHPINFDTKEFPRGEYFYQLITPYQKITKKFFIVN